MSPAVATLTPPLPAVLPPELPANRLALLEASGEITLPAAVLDALKPLRSERFLALSEGREEICLLPAEELPEAVLNAPRLALSGSLEHFGVADLFSLLTMSRRSGLLLLLSGSARRSLTFRRGEIVAAASSLPQDRIGQALYRTGKLSREALEQAEASLVPGKRFGRILLEQKLLDLETLHWGLRYQAEEIVYAVFRLHRGRFFLFDGDFGGSGELPLPLDTQGVLMEGFQRIDELSRIGKRIRDAHAVFRPTARRMPAGADERLHHVLALIGGGKSVEEIVRATGWGEFATFKALHQLLEEGWIEEAEGPAEPREDPVVLLLCALIDRYSRAFQLLVDVLKAKSTAVDLARVADAFLRNASDQTRAVLQGIPLGAPQRLPTELLLENADRLLAQGTEPRRERRGTTALLSGELIGRALAEWTAFQSVVVRNLLPAFEARELLSYVRAIEQSG